MDSIFSVLDFDTIEDNTYVDNFYCCTNITFYNTAIPQQKNDLLNYILPILGVLIGVACTSLYHYFMEKKEQ